MKLFCSSTQVVRQNMKRAQSAAQSTLGMRLVSTP